MIINVGKQVIIQRGKKCHLPNKLLISQYNGLLDLTCEDLIVKQIFWSHINVNSFMFYVIIEEKNKGAKQIILCAKMPKKGRDCLQHQLVSNFQVVVCHQLLYK